MSNPPPKPAARITSKGRVERLTGVADDSTVEIETVVFAEYDEAVGAR